MSELQPILDSLFQAPFAPATSVRLLVVRRLRRRRRRTNTRIAAAVCGAVAVIAFTRATDAHRNEVHTIDGGDRTPASVTPSSTPSGAAAGGPDSTATGATTPASAVIVPPPSSSTSTTAPGTNGCAVESEGNAVDVTTPVGGAGMGGYERTCEFNATVAGGYVAHGTWRLDITRHGQLYGYSSRTGSPACAPVGAIEVGDHVTLTIDYGSEAVADPAYLRAGPDYHC